MRQFLHNFCKQSKLGNWTTWISLFHSSTPDHPPATILSRRLRAVLTLIFIRGPRCDNCLLLIQYLGGGCCCCGLSICVAATGGFKLNIFNWIPSQGVCSNYRISRKHTTPQSLLMEILCKKYHRKYLCDSITRHLDTLFRCMSHSNLEDVAI